MKIEVLVSTMNLENPQNLLEEMNIDKTVIINQVQEKKLQDITVGENRCYSYQEKGLSKSRNKAIMHSDADICIIADDDLKYEDNYEKIVEEGYKKYPDADIIAFHVDNVNKKLQKAIRKEGKINFITSMKIQSVQTTFKRKSIIDNSIKFNEMFGAGVELYSGEENIFLSDCIKNRLKIYYIPNKIATIQDNNSTWMKGHDRQYFNAKGATFYAISSTLYCFFIIQYAIRKRKRYKKEMSVLNAIRYMCEGVKKYKKEKRG